MVLTCIFTDKEDENRQFNREEQQKTDSTQENGINGDITENGNRNRKISQEETDADSEEELCVDEWTDVEEDNDADGDKGETRKAEEQSKQDLNKGGEEVNRVPSLKVPTQQPSFSRLDSIYALPEQNWPFNRYPVTDFSKRPEKFIDMEAVLNPNRRSESLESLRTRVPSSSSPAFGYPRSQPDLPMSTGYPLHNVIPHTCGDLPRPPPQIISPYSVANGFPWPLYPPSVTAFMPGLVSRQQEHQLFLNNGYANTSQLSNRLTPGPFQNMYSPSSGAVSNVSQPPLPSPLVQSPSSSHSLSSSSRATNSPLDLSPPRHHHVPRTGPVPQAPPPAFRQTQYNVLRRGPVRRPRDPSKPPPEKKYKCEICGQRFSRSNTLVTHRVSVSNKFIQITV